MDHPLNVALVEHLRTVFSAATPAEANKTAGTGTENGTGANAQAGAGAGTEAGTGTQQGEVNSASGDKKPQIPLPPAWESISPLPLSNGKALFSQEICIKPSEVMVPPPPKQLGDGTWRVTCIDGTTYRSRFKPKPRRIPPTAPPKPTALTKPATPSPPSLPSPPASIPSPVGANLPPSTLSAATEDATAQDAPMDTSDDVMALEADALNIFPNTPFQPGGQAAQAGRRNNNNHSSGNVRHAPYPKTKPQTVASSADLSANNTKSTGAALMGGALASGVGGVASSHTSAVQAAAGPTSSTSPVSIPDDDPQVCRWRDCPADTRERSVGNLPYFSDLSSFKRHMKIHTEKKWVCDKCGDEICPRGDAVTRHKNSDA